VYEPSGKPQESHQYNSFFNEVPDFIGDNNALGRHSIPEDETQVPRSAYVLRHPSLPNQPCVLIVSKCDALSDPLWLEGLYVFRGIFSRGMPMAAYQINPYLSEGSKMSALQQNLWTWA
jgi:hypothetical protein